MTPTLVFDPETIPDADGLRKLNGWGEDVPDAEVVERALTARREAAVGMTSCRCTCTRSRWWAACSVTTRAFASRRWASPTIPSAALLAGFFKTIERYTPKLVSWNGSGFDLPVLHYRSPILGARAALLGHGRGRPRVQVQQLHLALPQPPHRPMDLLASTTAAPTRRWTNWPSSAAFPASWAWTAARSGKPGARAAPTRCGPIARPTWSTPGWCTRAFASCAANSIPSPYEAEIALVRDTLSASDAPHWKEYLDAWKG